MKKTWKQNPPTFQAHLQLCALVKDWGALQGICATGFNLGQANLLVSIFSAEFLTIHFNRYINLGQANLLVSIVSTEIFGNTFQQIYFVYTKHL